MIDKIDALFVLPTFNYVQYLQDNNFIVSLNDLDESKWFSNENIFLSYCNVKPLTYIPSFRMKDETVNKINEFFKRYEKFCTELIFIEKNQNYFRESIFRFLFFPNYFEKLTIDIQLFKSAQISLFKNMSLMNIRNIVFEYLSGAFNYKEQIYAVIRDSFTYKSKITMKTPFMPSILSYSFFNKENLANLKEIKTSSLQGKDRLDCWKKSQFTTLIREMGKNKNLSWTINERIVSYKELLQLAWK